MSSWCNSIADEGGRMVFIEEFAGILCDTARTGGLWFVGLVWPRLRVSGSLRLRDKEC